MTTGRQPFDPKAHITRVTGRDYLEVKWRLVWLRDEHPDAVVESEMIGHDDAFALFRAKVSTPGGGSAVAHGREDEVDFHDYIEKAETKALGRALAALGYGTQFCEDYQEGHVADGPVEAPPGPRPAGPVPQGRPVPKASAAQVKAIYALGRELGHESDAKVDLLIVEKWGAKPADLTVRQASDVISALSKDRPRRTRTAGGER